MVDYSAARFDDVKRTGIAELGMGANAKLNLQLSSRHWWSLGNNADTHTDTGDQNTSEATRGQPGKFSYWKVGRYTKFAGAEAARSGNCHFAGAHTSIESPGYPNGAVETGERVTSEILADIKALA